MSDTLTLTGLVATPPRHVVTGAGLHITSFRLASTQRKFDRGENKWVDADTNWYTITTFRQLAINVIQSLNKGQRIVVTGRLRVRDWATDDNKGTNIEIDADSIGHDLTFGTSVFTRSAVAALAASEAGEGEHAPDETAAGAETDDAAGEGWAASDAVAGDADTDDVSESGSSGTPLALEPAAAALPF